MGTWLWEHDLILSSTGWWVSGLGRAIYVLSQQASYVGLGKAGEEEIAWRLAIFSHKGKHVYY